MVREQTLYVFHSSTICQGVFSVQNVVDIGVCSKWALEKNVYSAVVGGSSLEMWVCVCTCSVAQSCPTQDPMVYSPPGSSVHGILPLRILECVAISSSGEIFPTQGSNSCFLHWQANSLPRSPWEARRCQCIQLINGAVEFTYFTFYKENIFMYFMS